MIPVTLAALGLFFVQSLLPSSIRYLQSREQLGENLGIALRGRDDPPPMPVLGGRAQRALINLGEGLVVFLPLALLMEVHGLGDGVGGAAAWAYVGIRAVYVPAYLSAIPGLRSTVWVAGVGALGVMGWQLLSAA